MSPIFRMAVLAAVLWSTVVALSLGWSFVQSERQMLQLAEVEAKSNLKRDLAFRRWATGRGGLYARVTDSARPNPFLAHIPDRDVMLPDGGMLTLYNPATMLREIKTEQAELYGTLARITGEKYLNPINAPDEWEKKALAIIKQTGQDYSEVTRIDGKPYLRRIQPMMMEEGCMKCHAWSGIKVGEMRGATDIAIPLSPYGSVAAQSRIVLGLTHGGIWLLGLVVIGFIARRSATHTDQLSAHQAVLNKFKQAVEQSASGVVITDARGNIEYINRKFCEVNGYAPEEVLGRNPRLLKSGETDDAIYQEMWSALSERKEWRGEFKNRKKSGEVYWCMESISPIIDASGAITHFVAVIEDINDRKFAEATIRQLALYDPLTELPNRRLLREKLDQAFAWSQRAGKRVALLYLDLDRFKAINDTLGHHTGDLLLKAVARRFSGSLRRNDTLARLGGDEFAVVVGDVDTEADAAAVAEKLLEAAGEPFVIEGRDLYVTVSIGISLFPTDTDSLDTLLRNADVAMYHAKECGKNRYQFFGEGLALRVSRQWDIESGLRRVTERNELFVEYQPKMEIGSGRVYGMEALVRWDHPTLGRIAPDRFIPVAEETGDIEQIGEWVLQAACAQAQRWRELGHPLLLSVNLSAVQFRAPDLHDKIDAVLKRTGFPAKALELEITESAIMNNPDQAVETMRAVRALGVSIAIDDFGTGYSSLSQLKRFPVSVLKIDRAFVRDITHDNEDRAIARAVIALAKTMHLSVIAEGVETAQQLALLREMECDCIQGYLLSRPLPPDAFEAFILSAAANQDKTGDCTAPGEAGLASDYVV
ncbi:MAG TPA: EAL domain-containing protein [Noviherbaspirillum sp.]|uniref:EAL domain-containing protein n=1 Tax=Noviherbaspirillum sp. TaxID=1926288 RepID=UPI002D23510F|nr:EAL domain-containing protein [Noviherbaspirillum sp.]HYD93964.1 EAL domain-containing protein [Noviherbaspirillum sp.]